MPTRRLTDQAVRSLRPDTRQVDYWDVSPKNFGVRVSQAGRKTFIVRYRTAGRYRRMSLGVYPIVSLSDARGHAKQVLGEVASNDDPAQVRQDARRAPSFEALAALYLEKHARVKKKSWRQDRRVIENELLRNGASRCTTCAGRTLISIGDGGRCRHRMPRTACRTESRLAILPS